MRRALVVVLALVGLTAGSLFLAESHRLATAPSEAQIGLFKIQVDIPDEMALSAIHLTAHRTMIAIGVLIAALLALVLARRPLQAHGANLRMSLALGSASLGYVLAFHPWAWLNGWTGPGALILASAALTGSMVALWLFARFAASYPQPVVADDLPERAPIDWFASRRLSAMAEELGVGYFRAWWIDLKRGLNPRAFSDFLKTGERPSKPRATLVDRQLHRALQGYQLVGGLCVLVVASLLFDDYGEFGFLLAWLFAPALLYLPASMHYWEIGYARGNESERRTIRWMLASIYLAVVLYLGLGLVFIALGLFGFAISTVDPMILMLFFLMWLFPGAWFLLLLSIAASIFLRGAVEPTLILKRSMLYGLIAVVMTTMFVTFENLLETAALARLGLSQQSTVIITGTAVALALGPLRDRIERVITRLVEGLLPS